MLGWISPRRNKLTKRSPPDQHLLLFRTLVQNVHIGGRVVVGHEGTRDPDEV